jgi:hypothetical protein
VLNLLSSLHVTAAGDKNLSEEAVHLTGGMLAAEHVGHVIATTWSSWTMTRLWWWPRFIPVSFVTRNLTALELRILSITR